MILFVTILLWGLAVMLAVPSFTLAIQCVAGCVTRRKNQKTSLAHREPCTVLIPAHNEAQVISATLCNLLNHVRPTDRIIVIADNCDDPTCQQAIQAGVEAIERNSPGLRGKGYAMQFGIDSIRNTPPEIVVFLDADCRIQSNSLDRLVDQAARTGRVAQANYRMRRLASEATGLNTKSVISEFAVLIKNWVRPRGMMALGLPCHLTGSGMAFPWEIASKLPFATSNIVEDMALGCELMRVGKGPLFCEEAEILASLPATDAASLEQRKRWEHGHLHTLFHQMPRILFAAITQRRLDLLGVTFDLTVPPLTLLVLSLIGCWVASALFVFQNAGPFWLLTIEIFTIAFALSWSAVKFSDDKHLGSAFWSLPAYAMSKLPLYLGFVFFGRQRQWIRTSREPLETSEAR